MPPYSSTTSARWMRVACIFSSRSSAGIDGGTNSISRMILVDDSCIDEIDRAEIEAGGALLLAPRRLVGIDRGLARS